MTMVFNVAEVGLPANNPTTSYWQSEFAHSTLHDHGRDVALPYDVKDVAVIGSGISGAVAAYMLQHGGDVRGIVEEKMRSPSIIMLEARQACSGATGRNGGHCRPDVFLGYRRYASIVGAEQSRKVLQNEWETYNLTNDIVEVESLDCDWWTGETLAVLREESLKGVVHDSFEEYRALVESDGGVFRAKLVNDAAEAKKISRVYDALAVAVWPAASLHPIRFVHGMLEKCLGRSSFQLFTHTPVLRTRKSAEVDGVWELETSRGVVRARKVLLATNGYSTMLLPALKDFLTPHRSQCSAIKPPQNFVQQHALLTTASIIKAKGDYEYLTQQPSTHSINPPRGLDGRAGSGAFILGGGHPHAPFEEQIDTFDDTVIIESIRDHLALFPERTFIDWKAGQGTLDSVWTGIQGYTKDSLPIVGEHFEREQESIFLCLGHHGHGMARAVTCARGVARQILASLQRGDDISAAGMTNSAWENETGLPACYRWTDARRKRSDIDCRRDF